MLRGSVRPRRGRTSKEREAVVAELARDRVLVNSREPTLLCLVVTKLRGSRNILPETPAKFEKWVSPGWFSRPVGFNAGKLRDQYVPRVVERLQRLGDVHEVEFHSGSLNGLRLFISARSRMAGSDWNETPARSRCTPCARRLPVRYRANRSDSDSSAKHSVRDTGSGS